MAVTKVVMPKLSDAMESGKIIKWLKKEGDQVKGGDILAEVETDKADVEMEAFGAGVLRKILVPAGETAAIGALIGVIAEPGDDIAALVASAPAGAGAGSGPAAQKTPLRAEPAPAPTPAGAASAAASASRPAAVTRAGSGGAGCSAGGGGQRARRRSRWPRARSARRAGEGVAVGEEDCGAERGRPAAAARVGAGGADHSARCRGRRLEYRRHQRRVGRRDARGRRLGGGVRGCAAHADSGGDRAPDASVQGAGTALLRHERSRDGPGVGAARAAERAGRVSPRSPSTTS